MSDNDSDRSGTPPAAPVLYQLEEVAKQFGRLAEVLRGARTVVTALDGITLEIRRGETMGLVGESGSGKTTLGRLLVGLERSTQGRVLMNGADVGQLKGKELAAFRRQVQMIYQNPFSSLNPRRTIRDALSSGYEMRSYQRGSRRDDALAALLQRVGLHRSMLDRYPHEFSGGQRQRIVIARALSVGPSVLVADEPVSALDVSIQAQVLSLLGTLKRDSGLTMVMITHDLRVANFFCDRIAMLYRGRLVELAKRGVIIERSSHPYTRMLMSAAPSGDPDRRVPKPWVRGEVDLSDTGREACVFASRCWMRSYVEDPDRCTTERPQPRLLEDGHVVACHFAEQVRPRADELEAQETTVGVD